ncbi:uncharacterized protein V6R79_008005 [Siganus canaliculatus]
MRPHMLLVALLQAALVESLQEVSGFLGETVILPSGANTASPLTSIQWSIYSNITLIATYRSQKINTERFYRYKGRLSLNISTGDLTIHNINEKDAIEYSLNLISTQEQSTRKVKLTVKQRLQQPTIEIFQKKDSCEVALRCSSPEKDVVFSWKVDPLKISNVTFLSGTNSAVLVASLSATQSSVEFTCTANRSPETTSSTIAHGCNATESGSDAVRVCPLLPPQSRSRTVVCCVFALFIGVFSTFLLCAFGGESKSSVVGNVSVHPTVQDVSQLTPQLGSGIPPHVISEKLHETLNN